MAQAPADPGETGLDQRILRVLREAGSPLKTAQLVKECQVPKKTLNQALYRMKGESKVALVDPATWSLNESGTGDVDPAEPAPPAPAKTPPQGTVAMPQKLDPQLSKRQWQIYGFLEANGPHRALVIAQSLALKTAKDVNPDLYAMRSKHILDYDQNSKVWAIYQAEDSRGRGQTTSIMYQQNPVNVICQNGPNSHISIQHSEGVQIGHGNVLVKQEAPSEGAPAGPFSQEPLAGSGGPQDIYMEKSVLRRVQLGHGNEMTLYNSTPATGPGCSPSVSPPASAPTAGPGTSFKMEMPAPGPHPEGDRDSAQRVHVTSCFLEDTAIGNSNRLSVRPRAAFPGAGPGPEGGSRGPGGPAEQAAPRSEAEAAEPGGGFPHDALPAEPDMSTFMSQLEAVTLESRDPEATEDGPCAD